MKLIVSLIIACVLFNKVYSLQCHECMGEGCNPETVTCPSAQKCGSRAVVSLTGEGNKPLSQERRCMQLKECISGSVNLGFKRIGINTTCCSTDRCNTDLSLEYSKQSPNGKKCYTCSERNCASTVSCLGDENSCVKTTEIDGRITMSKGCISSSLCAAADIPLLNTNFGQITCCKGDLCNAANSHAGLSLLLLLPLACFSLFH